MKSVPLLLLIVIFAVRCEISVIEEIVPVYFSEDAISSAYPEYVKLEGAPGKTKYLAAKLFVSLAALAETAVKTAIDAAKATAVILLKIFVITLTSSFF